MKESGDLGGMGMGLGENGWMDKRKENGNEKIEKEIWKNGRMGEKIGKKIGEEKKPMPRG
jgi:hypothetical protein